MKQYWQKKIRALRINLWARNSVSNKANSRMLGLIVSLSLIVIRFQSVHAGNVLLWDSVIPLADTTAPEDVTAWKVVPSDLLSLEREPAKARSDPGYYGREYKFKGDAVVENEKLSALFSGAKGHVALYTKEGAKRFSRKIAELAPLSFPSAGKISQVRIV